MKRFLLTFGAIALLISGCGEENQGTRGSLSGGGGDSIVQASSGKLYSITCLRNNASRIQSQGNSVMGECLVSGGSTSASSRGKLGLVNSYGYRTSWIYYPPTFYYPSAYQTTAYPPYYNPYNDSRFRQDNFCGYVFGASSNMNCYYILGYTNPTQYSNYYNPSCSSSCLYTTSSSPCSQSACVRPYYYY